MCMHAHYLYLKYVLEYRMHTEDQKQFGATLVTTHTYVTLTDEFTYNVPSR